MIRLTCSICGQPVSTEVPKDTIVKAWMECPSCTKAFVSTKTVPDKPRGDKFIGKAIFGGREERTHIEPDYEQLVQRMVDVLRMQRNKLPLVILISQA
jgi:hypothetical protein